MKSIILRFITVSLVLCMTLSTVITGVSADNKYGTAVQDSAVLNSDTMRLEIDKNGRVKLSDNLNGYIWYSNPAEHYTDKVSFGVNQKRVASQLLVSYLGSTIVMETKSFAQAVEEDGSYTEVYSSDNKIICVYYFVGLGFEIPVEYTLKGRQLFVSIASEGIKETKKNKLIDFAVNPFFGAGNMSEQGFIMLPDGSGTVIDFNNGKTSDNKLTLDVMYGNRSKMNEARVPSSKPVLIPCFGLSHSLDNGANATVLGYVTSGAIGGMLTANVAGRETGFNYAYYTFLYREYATETMLDRTWASKTRLVVSKEKVNTDKFEICYTFGKPDETAISEMASAAREHVFGNEKSKISGKLPVFLDMIMGVRVKKNFLGIPYKTLEPLTTVGQANEISAELKESGIISQEIRMQGITSDGYMGGKINSSIKPSRKIGTLKEIKKLSADEDVTVYPEVNSVEFNRSSSGASTFIHTTLDLLLDTVKKPAYLVAAGSENEDIKALWLLRPDKVKAISEKLAKSLSENKIEGVSPSSLGKGSYSNYSRKNPSDIAETYRTLVDSAKQLSNKSLMMLEAPTVDFWKYTNCIINLPENSSEYNICDRSVPFVQMVLSGLVAYSSSPINFSGNETEAILNCIKTGSAPNYKLFYKDYDSASDNDAKGLYAASYKSSGKGIIAGYKKISDALSTVWGKKITDFSEPQNGFSITTYENGAKVLVNTTSEEISFEGVKVASMSYALSETEAAQ